MPDYTSTPENFRVYYSIECLFFLSNKALVPQQQQQQQHRTFSVYVNICCLQRFILFSHKPGQTLSNCRADVCKALGMAEDQFELSMGMSGDFEQAVIIFVSLIIPKMQQPRHSIISCVVTFFRGKWWLTMFRWTYGTADWDGKHQCEGWFNHFRDKRVPQKSNLATTAQNTFFL